MSTASARDTVLEQRIREMGPWFHNLEIRGIQTAPDHPLGDFLGDLWTRASRAFPEDLSGATVLDIGCNAGFYSLKLHERGAQVTGIEHDPHYLAQARFAAAELGADIDYRLLDVYDVERLEKRYDYVLFMGVFYHLRHPLLGLERVARMVRRRLVFQSMLRGSERVFQPARDYPIENREVFEEDGFPAMYFVEHEYAGDPTNWWVPNRAAMEAMLRSCGLSVDEYDGGEVFFCSPLGG